tara:strand:+ start:783 stop:1082 length:300 start_codon:yes stop_codon:yes gene_type:complete
MEFKFNKYNMKKFSGEFISLYDHLGHAAGGKLGKKVAYAAVKAGVKPIIKELKTSYYEGEIYTYPSEFLDEYFEPKQIKTKRVGSLLDELPPNDYQLDN